MSDILSEIAIIIEDFPESQEGLKYKKSQLIVIPISILFICWILWLVIVIVKINGFGLLPLLLLTISVYGVFHIVNSFKTYFNKGYMVMSYHLGRFKSKASARIKDTNLFAIESIEKINMFNFILKGNTNITITHIMGPVLYDGKLLKIKKSNHSITFFLENGQYVEVYDFHRDFSSLFKAFE